jgi:hypothetical protein
VRSGKVRVRVRVRVGCTTLTLSKYMRLMILNSSFTLKQSDKRERSTPIAVMYTLFNLTKLN